MSINNIKGEIIPIPTKYILSVRETLVKAFSIYCVIFYHLQMFDI